MENTQNNTQVESVTSTNRNKKLVILVVVFAVIAVFALLVALGIGLRAHYIGTRFNSEVVAEVGSAQPYGDYPFTSLRKVTDDDLVYKSSRELRIMRNEIFARHGYIFDSKDMRKHFMSKNWYRPTSKNVILSDIEKYNVEFIKRYESL